MDKYKKFKNQFDQEVKQANSIIISSHYDPDPDSLSSVYALYYYLKNILNLDTNIRILYEGNSSDLVDKYPKIAEVEFVEDLSNHLSEDDLLIMLDMNSPNRISNYPDKILPYLEKAVFIDHHEDTKVVDYYKSFFDTSKASATEIIYNMFLSEKEPPKGVYELILVGILGDTGWYSFITPEKTSALDTSREIISKGGVSLAEIKSKYFTTSKGALAVMGEFLNNLYYKEVEGWPAFAYSYISKESLNKYEGKDRFVGWRKFAAEYLTNVEGYIWGFGIKPKPKEGGWSVSFRSVPESVNIRNIAAYFGGGGHTSSAGGFIEDPNKEMTVQDIVNKVLEYLKNNEPEFIGE